MSLQPHPIRISPRQMASNDRQPQLLRKLSAFNPSEPKSPLYPKSPSSIVSIEPDASSTTETDKRASHATFGPVSPEKAASSASGGRRSRRWSALGSGSIDEESSVAAESYFPSFRQDEFPRTPPRKARPVSMSSTPSRTPESEHAIHAQLLRSSSVNASRIVPRQRQQLSPPSTGTPLGVQVVERNKSLKREGSKLDHVLGHGAETARVILEIERRKEGDKKPLALETTPLPLPPNRRHQHTASHTTFTSPPVLHDRQRAGSLDSLTSLRPSLNESVSTLTKLLPPVPPRTALSTTRELSTTQRAQLLRRARKLEQVLGETLQEAQVGQHIVEPAGTTIDRQAWPGRPILPEWDAEDVVPQRASESGNPRPKNSSSVDPFASASSSSFGGRAVKALTRRVRGQRSKSDEADGLEIFIAREKVTVVRRDRMGLGLGQNELQSVNRPREVESAPCSPVSVQTTSSTSPRKDEREYDSDEEAKRERRLRLAKLHRLLGTTIPPAMMPVISRGNTPINERPPPIPSLLESSSSFISFDERPRRSNSPNWASKFIGASTRKSHSPSNEEPGTTLSSIVCLDRMTQKDKQVARRRANKLEHVFGTLPPQRMFVTSSQDNVHALPVTGGHARSASDATFDTYQQSLQGLLYLVEHNHDELGRIVDELGDIPSPDSHSPATSPFNSHEASQDSGPDSFATRRKRAGKLSHFFGEARVGQTQQSIKRSRKDVFEGMLGDVWKGAQAEAKTGALRREEMERLSSMMGALRKSRARLDDWEEP